MVLLADHLYQRDRTDAGDEDSASEGEETEAAARPPPAKKKKQLEINMLLQSEDEEEGGRREGDGGAKQEMDNYLLDKSKVKTSKPKGKPKSGSDDDET